MGGEQGEEEGRGRESRKKGNERHILDRSEAASTRPT